MADSAAVVEASNNKGSVETAVQNWISSNTPTSVDDVSTWRIGQNRVGVLIAYTA